MRLPMSLAKAHTESADAANVRAIVLRESSAVSRSLPLGDGAHNAAGSRDGNKESTGRSAAAPFHRNAAIDGEQNIY